MLVFGMMMITYCCHAVNNHFKMLEMDKCVLSMFKTIRHSRSFALFISFVAALQLHR